MGKLGNVGVPAIQPPPPQRVSTIALVAGSEPLPGEGNPKASSIATTSRARISILRRCGRPASPAGKSTGNGLDGKTLESVRRRTSSRLGVRTGGLEFGGLTGTCKTRNTSGGCADQPKPTRSTSCAVEIPSCRLRLISVVHADTPDTGPWARNAEVRAPGGSRPDRAPRNGEGRKLREAPRSPGRRLQSRCSTAVPIPVRRPSAGSDTILRAGTGGCWYLRPVNRLGGAAIASVWALLETQDCRATVRTQLHHDGTPPQPLMRDTYGSPTELGSGEKGSRRLLEELRNAP